MIEATVLLSVPNDMLRDEYKPSNHDQKAGCATLLSEALPDGFWLERDDELGIDGYSILIATEPKSLDINLNDLANQLKSAIFKNHSSEQESES